MQRMEMMDRQAGMQLEKIEFLTFLMKKVNG